MALTLALLAVWEGVVRLGWVSGAFLPAPTRVVASLGELVASGELVTHLSITLARMLVALVWGGGVGLLLGLALGTSARLRALLDPLIAALHPVPRMALLPVVLLLFGIGFLSKAMVVAISTFFPMVINTMGGVREVDPNYLDAARLYGASRRRIFWRVLLPASLPSILTGVRLATTRALGATIGLELITAQSGIGSMLFFAWQTYRAEDLYATVVVIAVLGSLFRAGIAVATRRLVPWRDGF